MGNALKGIVDVQACGGIYKLQFTINGMCEFEAAAERSFIEFVQSLSKGGDRLLLSDLRLLIWAGFQEHHPSMTLRQAGEIITDLGGLGPTMDIIQDAIGKAMPEPGPGEPGNGGAAARTGRRSSKAG